MSIERHLLLAADFLDAIVPLILMVLWAVGQLMGGKPKAKAKAPPARRVPPGQAVVPPPADGRQPTLEETLRREVEQFRQRAEGRAANAPKGPQPARTKREARPARSTPEQAVRRLADTSRPPIAAAAGPLASEPPRTTMPPTGAAVGQHVTKHQSGAREMAAHVQQLGADVAQSDERMQEHLQEKFAHHLGALEHRESAARASAVRSPMVQDLLNLLSQPAGVRQVVVASEILRRPEERWSRPGDV
jgi:hypothetical protein